MSDIPFWSIGGGVFAGLIAILIEVVGRSLSAWNQRRKAVDALEKYLHKWEADARDLPIDDTQFPHSEAVVHLESRLRGAHATLGHWSRFLTAQQFQEFTQLIVQYEGLILLYAKTASWQHNQELYADFFRDARRIEWLRF